MPTLAALYSAFGIVLLFASMFRGVAYRHLGVINLRNVFLLGFIYFEFYGVIYPLWTSDYGIYSVLTPTYTSLRWITYSALFLMCFYLSYHYIISKLDTEPQNPTFLGGQSYVTLLVLAICLSVGAYLGRFSGYVPLIGPLLNHALIALAATAAGVATFVLIRNFGNPVLAVPAVIAIGIGLLNTVLSDFGRRGLVGLLGAVLWCAYFSRTAPLTSRTVVLKVLPVAVAGMMFVGAFSQIRGDQHLQGDATARSEAIVQNLGINALTSLFAVPDTGTASLWLIDSRRTEIEIDPLLAARYFVLHFVPRSVMPNKIEPLSRRIPIENRSKGVAYGVHTVGPGIVGHVAADGGLPIAPLYGLAIGAVLGLLDRFLARNRHAPLAIAALGCTLGQVLGLARGDSAIFLGIILIGILSNLALLYALDRGTAQPLH